MRTTTARGLAGLLIMVTAGCIEDVPVDEVIDKAEQASLTPLPPPDTVERCPWGSEYTELHHECSYEKRSSAMTKLTPTFYFENELLQEAPGGPKVQLPNEPFFLCEVTVECIVEKRKPGVEIWGTCKGTPVAQTNDHCPDKVSGEVTWSMALITEKEAEDLGLTDQGIVDECANRIHDLYVDLAAQNVVWGLNYEKFLAKMAEDECNNNPLANPRNGTYTYDLCCAQHTSEGAPGAEEETTPEEQQSGS